MTEAGWAALPESEREWWIHRHQKQRAQHHCGHPIEKCSDPERAWFPQRAICYASMEEAAANAKYDDLYGGKFHDGTFKNWSEKRNASHPYGHRDGVRIWVAETDLDPDDEFLTAGASQKAGGDEAESEDAEE